MPPAPALPPPDSVEWAITQAQAALAAGQPTDALQWLGRAARLVPEGETARSPEWAVRQAQAAMAAGQPADAVRWLRRAARIVPADPTIPLVLASAYAQTDPGKAVTILRALTVRLPWHSEAALALCASLLRAGQPAGAADCLGAMLRRLNPAGLSAFEDVARSVCAAAGLPGWMWLDGHGVCHIRLAGSARAGTVRLSMDGVPLGTVRVRAGQPTAHRLPSGWRSAQQLHAALGDGVLAGSGVAPYRFGQVEGFVAASPNGSVEGWARLPADGAAQPSLWLHKAGGGRQAVGLDPKPDLADEQGARWRFTLGPSHLAGLDRAEITDEIGRNLWGSPLLLVGERDAARRAAQTVGGVTPAPLVDRFRPLPAALLPAAPWFGAKPARRPPCDVVVPVHGGAAELELCLVSLMANLPRASRVVLVNDGSPDPAITARLRTAAGAQVTVVEHALPRGFPAAVNAGLAQLTAGPGRDVVILNADTVVGPNWLARLSQVAHSDPAIGSVTPLTNDGTIVSFPSPGEPGEVPGAEAFARLNRLCWEANGPAAVPIPTGVGFCMLMKGACLAETGRFREDVFAQGYGEENDWCLRAAHLGWQHVAAPGVFVGHSGGRSFGAAKALLLERNAAVLERLHPGYAAYVADTMASEPLLPARRRIDWLRLLQAAGQGTIALVTHGAGGGVARHVAERCASLLAAGQRPIVLSPAGPGRCGLSLGEERLPNLTFELPGEGDGLAAVLAEAGVGAFEFHHLLDHAPDIAGLPARLGVPYEVFIHDYALWCPRVTLTSRSQRYCGEPLSVTECEECVADLGSRIGEDVDVGGLRRQSAALLAGARRVLVACEDVAGRIRRQFPGVKPEITASEAVPSAPPPHRPPPQSGTQPEVHVVVAGGIGIEKGYDVLLGCARDAARRALPLRFTVVGHTIDDGRLAVTGRAFVTGMFEEAEGLELVRQQAGTLGFMPSVWPETWCYALSMLFAAGLPVMAFGLGAQAERIGREGRGWLLPLGIPVTKINDALVRHGLETLQLST